MFQTASYVMGHDDRERRRLALQAEILAPFTEQLLRRAGISNGMRVLDLGCGVGDVSLLASKLVGNKGEVVGIDIDPAALETARQRARDQGRTNISFVQSAVQEYRFESAFDAVTGRHILIHTPDPVALLRSIGEQLREGGVVVMQEYDFSASHPAYPPWPLREELMRVFRDFFGQMTNGSIGTQLYRLFGQAGFAAPDCRAEYPIDGGADSPFYEWLAESVRALYPRAQPLGLVKRELNFDTLAEQLRDEAVSRHVCLPGPVMVGGFARKR
jgi:ubiquinone/menaquinone biosynthesis C-methylase UbiE